MSKQKTAKPKPKPSAKSAKPKPKQTAKSKSKSTAKSKTETKSRFGVAKYAAAAKLATMLAGRAEDGSRLGRAPISTNQIGMVSGKLKSQKQPTKSVKLSDGQTVRVAPARAKQYGFTSADEMVLYAASEIPRGELPDGVGKTLSELAETLDPKRTPSVHKLTGRALVAAILGFDSERS